MPRPVSLLQLGSARIRPAAIGAADNTGCKPLDDAAQFSFPSLRTVLAMSIGTRLFGRFRFSGLLTALLLLVILGPVVEEAALGRAALLILFTLLLAASAYAVSRHTGGLIAGISLAVTWAVVTWSRPFTEEVTTLTSDGLAICLLLHALGPMLHRIIAVREADFDTLCGAVAVYLLIGVVWGVSYRFIETLVPGSFDLTGTGAPVGWNDFLYFSLTTLTTLGYGDISPVTAVARIWTSLEAVAGVLYIALLVARLISIYRR